MPPCVLTVSLLPWLQVWPQGRFQDILSRAFWNCWAWWLQQIISVNKLWPVCYVCWYAGDQRNDLFPDSLNLRFSEWSGTLNAEWDEPSHRHRLLLWCEQVFVSKLHVNSEILHFCTLVTSGNLFCWRQSSIFLKIKSTLKICLTWSSKKKRDSIPFLSKFLIFY